ncbi:hypothetical protein CIT292_09695 [Citrobacter youngae ATCC 29220]|uniref:Uncharacterized protein n=1 Tax=Citrobacter youngae ATCC 29220 TaxID=500640 RepID=D4BGP4_9ENTR|nr:hypothetical protein CIT292_09695 [Citrobacter youngae ATCC 29220]
MEYPSQVKHRLRSPGSPSPAGKQRFALCYCGANAVSPGCCY